MMCNFTKKKYKNLIWNNTCLRSMFKLCYTCNGKDALELSILDSKGEQLRCRDSFKCRASCFEECKLNGDITFTTHDLKPEAIMARCYVKQPKAYVLKIKGQAWELGEGLTKNAQQNLKEAINLISEYV